MQKIELLRVINTQEDNKKVSDCKAKPAAT
jgi:hypothetical protein